MAASVAPATNAQYSAIRALLRSAPMRRREGLFVVEGPVLVAELMASPLRVSYLVGSPELLDGYADSDVDRFEAHPGKLSDALSTQSPQLLAAVVEIPQRPPVPAGGSLALVDMGDPGNVGTMMRTAEAAGMAAVLLVGECVDPFNPKVVRASAGAMFRLPVVTLSHDDLFSLGRSPVVATVVGDAESYLAANLADAIICLGNEAHGLTSSFVGRCDARITIPLDGPTESLNVAAAAAIVAFAALEQRRAITLAER